MLKAKCRRRIFARTMATTSFRDFMGCAGGVLGRQSRQAPAMFFLLFSQHSKIGQKSKRFFPTFECTTNCGFRYAGTASADPRKGFNSARFWT